MKSQLKQRFPLQTKWVSPSIVVAIVGVVIHAMACVADSFLFNETGDATSNALSRSLAIGAVASGFILLLVIIPSVITRGIAMLACLWLAVLWVPLWLGGSFFALLGATGGPDEGTFQRWQAAALFAVNVPIACLVISSMSLGIFLFGWACGRKT